MTTTTPFDTALAAIDAAHALDPTPSNTTPPLPYELHYAQQCTHYLSLRGPTASSPLRLACRAQHFRRWESPRSAYPMTKPGYLSWRLAAKKRAAAQVEQICSDAGFSAEDVAQVGRLIRKEGLKEGEEETAVLEDVACLVFLDDQFAEFRREHDEEKILGILRKTWGKMSGRGRELALEMSMGEEERRVVEKALAG